MSYIYVITTPVGMVKSKSELFDVHIQQCSEYFKALSHPARIAILKYLAETRTCITGDISDELPLSRSTVNQHLAELKKTGLIQGHIEGINTKYCLHPDSIQKMKKIANELFSQLNETDNCTC